MTIRQQNTATATRPVTWTSFDQLAAAVSAKLIRTPDTDLDQGIQAVLGWIGGFFEVDRVTVLEYRENEAKFTLSSSWQVPEVASISAEIPDELFPWATRRLSSGDQVSFSDLQELPPEAATDRRSFQRLGTRSHLSLPLRVGGAVVGVLSLSTVTSRRDRAATGWSDVPVVRLRLLGDALAGALDRRKIRAELRLSERRAHNAVANTTEAVWCMEFGDPLPLDLPEEEAIEEIYRRGRMVEMNDAMARIFGFENVDEMGEYTMEDYFDRDSESTWEMLRTAVRADFRVVDLETVEGPPGGEVGIYLNNFSPEIVDGEVVRVWGTSRDVTEVRRAEEQMRRLSAGREATGSARTPAGRRPLMPNRRPDVTILRSKLYRPPVAADFVSREALEARLDAGLRRPLTLVSAPAGYGKTTLVSRWLETCELPSAWLSLDEEDADTVVFLQYFVAAVRTLFADACRDSLALANAPERPPTLALAVCLSNDLDAIGEPFVLALDDYHRVATDRLHESAVHDLLDHLLSRPPRGFHLAIVSRRDPPVSLMSLRARDLVTEIRTGDLQFTAQESATFLKQSLTHPVDEASLQRLQESTEGWPVALRLATLALRNDGGVDELARGITGDSWQVREYLVAEVLSQQGPAVRDWLYRTSILERFCAPLAEAVCRSEDRQDRAALRARDFIRILESRGLFCIALDARRDWYRYHHLFQEVLQSGLAEQHLGGEEIVAIHARAAAWFESEGLIAEAIRHLMKSEGSAAAGRLILRHRHEITHREQWYRLDSWLRQLGAEVVGESAELLLLKAWSLENRDRHRELWATLDRVEARLGESPSESPAGKRLSAEVDALRSFQQFTESHGAVAIALAQSALDELPEEYLAERGFATNTLATAHQMNGDLARAHDRIYDALAADPRPGGADEGRLLSTLSKVHWIAADLRALQQAAARSLELGTELDLVGSSILGCYFLGIAQYHRDQLDEAERSLTAVAVDRFVPNASFFAHSAFALAQVYQARGQSRKAREAARSVVDYALRNGHQPLLRTGEAFLAELALRQGRLAEASSWARRLEPEPFRPPTMFYAPEVTLAKVLLAEGSAESRDLAGDLLTRWEEYLAAIHNRRFLIETLALKALLRDAQGDEPAAVELLGRAVSLAQPGRWVRLFVDLGSGLVGLLHHLEVAGDTLRYVGEILAAFHTEGRSTRPPRGDEGESADPPEAPAKSQPLPEPLTPRELEILGLLSERLTNREIANRLFISPGTVKRHSHNLYEKLGVSDRREVVTKALGLGILTDC